MTVLDSLLGNSKTPSGAQQRVHTGEVFQLWHHLIMRYDVYELTDIFQNFANDMDFKAILSLGMDMLKEEIAKVENEMNSLGIPLPPRPPKSINTPTNTEILRDEHMFRIIYMGIQNFVSEHIRTVIMMDNEKLKDIFIKMQRNEIDVHNKLTKYGRLKGWLFIPPEYKGE